MYFEGLCMCMCVFCACATIPSEIQSCDVPLIYTIPPNTPTEYLYWFLCYFYKINNCSVWHTNCFDLFHYVELQWSKKCTFYFTHSLEQSHTPFARTLNGAWKYGLIVRMLLSAIDRTSARKRQEVPERRWHGTAEQRCLLENKLLQWWLVSVSSNEDTWILLHDIHLSPLVHSSSIVGSIGIVLCGCIRLPFFAISERVATLFSEFCQTTSKISC